MTDTHSSEEINAEYRRKIPVLGEEIDKEDSEDYLLYKSNMCTSKGRN